MFVRDITCFKWQKKEDIAQRLWRAIHNNTQSLYNEMQTMPKNATLLIYNMTQQTKHVIVRDGHIWQLRNDSRIRSDRLHKKLDSGQAEYVKERFLKDYSLDVELNCRYSHSDILPPFKRRIYWLDVRRNDPVSGDVKIRRLLPCIHLYHYLIDATNILKTTSNKTSRSNNRSRNQEKNNDENLSIFIDGNCLKRRLIDRKILLINPVTTTTTTTTSSSSSLITTGSTGVSSNGTDENQEIKRKLETVNENFMKILREHLSSILWPASYLQIHEFNLLLAALVDERQIKLEMIPSNQSDFIRLHQLNNFTAPSLNFDDDHAPFFWYQISIQYQFSHPAALSIMTNYKNYQTLSNFPISSTVEIPPTTSTFDLVTTTATTKVNLESNYLLTTDSCHMAAISISDSTSSMGKNFVKTPKQIWHLWPTDFSSKDNGYLYLMSKEFDQLLLQQNYQDKLTLVVEISDEKNVVVIPSTKLIFSVSLVSCQMFMLSIQTFFRTLLEQTNQLTINVQYYLSLFSLENGSIHIDGKSNQIAFCLFDNNIDQFDDEPLPLILPISITTNYSSEDDMMNESSHLREIAQTVIDAIDSLSHERNTNILGKTKTSFSSTASSFPFSTISQLPIRNISSSAINRQDHLSNFNNSQTISTKNSSTSFLISSSFLPSSTTLVKNSSNEPVTKTCSDMIAVSTIDPLCSSMRMEKNSCEKFLETNEMNEGTSYQSTNDDKHLEESKLTKESSSRSPPPSADDLSAFLHSTNIEDEFQNLTLTENERNEFYRAAITIQKAYRRSKRRRTTHETSDPKTLKSEQTYIKEELKRTTPTPSNSIEGHNLSNVFSSEQVVKNSHELSDNQSGIKFNSVKRIEEIPFDSTINSNDNLIDIFDYSTDNSIYPSCPFSDSGMFYSQSFDGIMNDYNNSFSFNSSFEQLRQFNNTSHSTEHILLHPSDRNNNFFHSQSPEENENESNFFSFNTIPSIDATLNNFSQECGDKFLFPSDKIKEENQFQNDNCQTNSKSEKYQNSLSISNEIVNSNKYFPSHTYMTDGYCPKEFHNSTTPNLSNSNLDAQSIHLSRAYQPELKYQMPSIVDWTFPDHQPNDFSSLHLNERTTDNHINEQVSMDNDTSEIDIIHKINQRPVAKLPIEEFSGIDHDEFVDAAICIQKYYRRYKQFTEYRRLCEATKFIQNRFWHRLKSEKTELNELNENRKRTQQIDQYIKQTILQLYAICQEANMEQKVKKNLRR
ncbi:hypothetical protein SNEBB_006748 [Seison nebaliae]|nr:hypothetical protein SNEBB_006748 [Seison nebaliae]